MKNKQNTKKLITLFLFFLINKFISMESSYNEMQKQLTTKPKQEELIDTSSMIIDNDELLTISIHNNFSLDEDISEGALFLLHSINLFNQEYQKQKQDLQASINNLESELRQTNKIVEYETFATKELQKQIQYIKSSCMSKIIKFSYNDHDNLYNGFQNLILFLADNHWKIEGHCIFKHNIFIDNVSLLINFDKEFNDFNPQKNNRKAQYRFKFNLLIDLFKDENNFTNNFQNSYLQFFNTTIQVKDLFLICSKIANLSNILASLEINHLQKSLYIEIQKPYYLNTSFKSFLIQGADFLENLIYLKEYAKKISPLRKPLGFPYSYKYIADSQEKIFESIFESLFIKRNNNSFAFCFAVNITGLGYDSQYAPGDCSFIAENVTRLEFLHDLLTKDSKKQGLYHVFYYYLVKTQKKQNKKDMTQLSNIEISNVSSVYINILQEYLKANITTNEKIINDIIDDPNDYLSQYFFPPITSFTSAINYLKKYYGLEISQQDHNILCSLSKNNQPLNILSMVQLKDGEIEFAQEWSSKLLIKIDQMIKLCVTSFILNESYFPSVVRSTENSFFNESLISNINTNISYIIDGSDKHSKIYYPFLQIPLKMNEDELKILLNNQEKLEELYQEINNNKELNYSILNGIFPLIKPQ